MLVDPPAAGPAPQQRTALRIQEVDGHEAFIEFTDTGTGADEREDAGVSDDADKDTSISGGCGCGATTNRNRLLPWAALGGLFWFNKKRKRTRPRIQHLPRENRSEH